MVWAVLLVTVIVLLVCCCCCFYESERDRLLSSVPGPKPVPIVGNILEYLGLNQADIFLKTRGFAARFGDRYRLKVFNRRILNICNPDDAEIVLTSARNIKKSFIYSFLSSWLQEGLLLSFGTKWHERRKVLTPAFHFSILQEFLGVIDENSRRLVQALEPDPERLGQPTNITPLVSHFALHSICETAMGTQLDTDKSRTAIEYKAAISKLGLMLLQRLTRFWQHWEWIYRRTAAGKKYHRLLKVIHSFPEKVIEDRRATREPVKDSVNTGPDDLFMNRKKRFAMLDLLLDAESRNEIDMKGIKEEVDTFMFEGHDTTAMAITYTLMLLASHESVQMPCRGISPHSSTMQEAVLEECERVLGGGGGGGVNMSTMSDLRYLEACIKEALRLYPSVPFISRVLTEDIQLRDVLVKAGTTCHVHIFDLHRRADLFADPEAYRPERFLAAPAPAPAPASASAPAPAARNRHPFGYIPFSAGPRNCIGQRFAMLEMKCAVSAVVRSYRLRAATRPGDIVFLADLLLRPRDPIYVHFERR